jgi:hypothetical protein
MSGSPITKSSWPISSALTHPLRPFAGFRSSSAVGMGQPRLPDRKDSLKDQADGGKATTFATSIRRAECRERQDRARPDTRQYGLSLWAYHAERLWRRRGLGGRSQ